MSTPDTSPFFLTLRFSKNLKTRLNEKFVKAPADKASKDYTFVCKRYYVSILIEELGFNSITMNPTYVQSYRFCLQGSAWRP